MSYFTFFLFLLICMFLFLYKKTDRYCVMSRLHALFLNRHNNKQNEFRSKTLYNISIFTAYYNLMGTFIVPTV